MTDTLPLPADEFLVKALIADNYRDSSLNHLKLNPTYYTDVIAHARLLERIAKLEATNADLERTVVRFAREIDEVRARLAEYEPQENPDLSLAREVAAKYCRGCCNHRLADETMLGEHDKGPRVQCALAGIKTGRELGRGL